MIKENLQWPNGLAIDRPQGRIYWNDAKLKTIESSDFNGKDRKLIIKDVPHPYGLVVVGNHMYWTDWQTQSLHRAEKLSGTDGTIILKNLDGLMDVRSVQRENMMENACGQNNGGCSHLCLRNPTSYTCECPTGIQMTSKNKCAHQPNNYLLFTTRSALVRISLDTPELWDVTLPIDEVEHASDVDFHWQKQLLYFTNNEKDIIYSVDMFNLSNITPIIHTNLSSPNAIAVDWIANNLYWTNSDNKIIEVAKLDGRYRKTIVKENLVDPRSLAVFPRKGYLFWTDWSDKAKIERSFLDGTSRKIIVSNDLGYPNGLTIDYKAKILYWADAKLDKIEKCKLDGSGRVLLIHGSTTNVPTFNPFGLAQVIEFYLLKKIITVNNIKWYLL